MSLCISLKAAAILISGNPFFSSSAPTLDIVHMDHVCGNTQITATFVFCREGADRAVNTGSLPPSGIPPPPCVALALWIISLQD